MKNLTLILIAVSFCYASNNLDALLQESKAGEQKAQQIGWLAGKKMPLIPLTSPDKLFGDRAAAAPVPPAPTPAVTPTDYNLLMHDIQELQVSQMKISLIIESLQKQSNTHSGNMDFVTKMCEILAGAISTIVVAYITKMAIQKKQ